MADCKHPKLNLSIINLDEWKWTMKCNACQETRDFHVQLLNEEEFKKLQAAREAAKSEKSKNEEAIRQAAQKAAAETVKVPSDK